MRESEVERYLVKRIEALGGTCEKFKSPNRRFVPDRIIFWPAGLFTFAPVPVFVEVKAPGKEPNAGQQRDHDRRRAAGYVVYVIDSKEQVDEIWPL